jgi:hypothetical protein
LVNKNFFIIFVAINKQIKQKNIMLAKDKITEIFCIADDFCKEFDREFKNHQMLSNDDKKHCNRPHEMSESEIMTVLPCFHFGSFLQFQALLPVLCG